MHVSVDSTLVIFYSCGVMLQIEEFSFPLGMDVLFMRTNPF